MKLALVQGERVWTKPLSTDAKAKASRERQAVRDAKKAKRREKIKAAKKAQWVEQKHPGSLFYDSREWLELRYQALAKYGARCQCCGATRDSGATIHVDHIKPRSLFPKLQLRLDNLQILCRPCNIGKSNKDETDWR